MTTRAYVIVVQNVLISLPLSFSVRIRESTVEQQKKSNARATVICQRWSSANERNNSKQSAKKKIPGT